MKICVTGASGNGGQAVVAELVAHGYQVHATDLARPALDSPADGWKVMFTQADLTDYGQAAEVLAGMDAVVHLANIPAPGLRPPAVTFNENMTMNYNVFSAAAVTAGLSRVVWASSETVLGLPFTPETPPPYIPVDEEYHPRPSSAYSLANTQAEELAAQFCRLDPNLSMTGLRFSNVMEPADYAAFPDFDADPNTRCWNLWGYIDARDGAQAVRLALVASRPGKDVFIVANADTVMSRPSAELAAQVFPGVPVTRELGEHETLPQHSWRQHAAESG